MREDHLARRREYQPSGRNRPPPLPAFFRRLILFPQSKTTIAGKEPYTHHAIFRNNSPDHRAGVDDRRDRTHHPA